MRKFVIKKIAEIVLLFIGITFVSFLVIHLAPGSPGDQQTELNPKMTAQAKEKLRELYGLDKPVLIQYADWCRRLAVLDFGRSFQDGQPVTKKIGEAARVTIAISIISLLIIFLIGVPLGVSAAVRRGRLWDKIVTQISLVSFSIPGFWLALILVSLFGVRLRWFPVLGLHSVFFDELSFTAKIFDVARHLVLPLFVVSFAGTAAIARYTRSRMIEVLDENYIRTAYAKGLSKKRVLYRHALPNALLPVITILGLSVPGLLGGSVIFETIFSIPGMGRLFYQAVFARDYPVIMGMMIIGAALTLLGNLAADLGYAAADPRIRSEMKDS